MAKTKLVDTTVTCACCGRRFIDVIAFDYHRHGRGVSGGCNDPARLRNRAGYLAMTQVAGIWRMKWQP